MASSSGTGTGMSSGSSTVTETSVLSEGLQITVDERKRKRMISNKESARRSRMRKKKRLDDLTAQVTQLRNDNRRIITRVNITVQHFLNVEAENSVLRAQAYELSRILQSLEELISFLNANL
ncbi:hypothetical protein HRI_002485100 [Hibiscus trionum]|uniref:BZIP domain-containing protein n=1 Tax=Hibiscus trionum TaxID=183268 RepID=A0A9W7M515_HIBTR|nr:hypothetical protein HRI_002485100 [Hibiscus trionum]